MTVLLMLILCFYATMQSIKLFEYGETDIMFSSRDSYFSNDFVYSKDLMYAFGITAFDGNPEPIDDPSYGVLKPFYKSWGIKPGQSGIDWQELPTRACTEAELGINGKSDPDSLFYKPHKNTESHLEVYHKKLKCLDLDKVEIQGDYNSAKARSFTVLFVKCDSSTF